MIINQLASSHALTQEKSAVPTQEIQIITPDEGYLLSGVTVGAIPENFGLVTYDQNRIITVS